MPTEIALSAPKSSAITTAQSDEWDFLDREYADAPIIASTGQPDPKDGHLHGFVYGMSYEDYAAVDAMNGSKIVQMRKSPMYYRYACDNPMPETQAMKMGTLTHRMVLEPKTAMGIVVWKPEEKMLKRAGKKWDAFASENASMTILTESEYSDILNMASSALNSEPIRKYAHAEGPTEVCMFWRDVRTGQRMKARIDKLIPSTHTIPDLKTTRDCRSFRFPSLAYQLGYIVKMAHYSDGYSTLTGVDPSLKLLAIESKAPHESVVYDVPRDIMLIGLEERDSLLDKISECEASGKWPARELDEVTMTIPPWASMEADTEFELEV